MNGDASPLLRSPLSWTGSKTKLAPSIVEAFPAPTSYDVYAEPFVGSCAVLFCKPSYSHLEAVNDTNRRLVSFWTTLRDRAEQLIWGLSTLPYSEALFAEYRASLQSGEPMETLEEVVRWYYVQRSTFAGHSDPTKGWKHRLSGGKIMRGVPSDATSYQNAVDLLEVVVERLSRVQIHCTDFATFIAKYATHPRVLFYCDPPYVGCEHYYRADGTAAFTREDHTRLATLLNETEAKVALSYYEVPELDDWYPTTKWRRLLWTHVKETSRLNHELQVGRELLLMNYPASAPSLWRHEHE